MNRTDTPGFVEDVDFDVGGVGDADGPAHSSVLWVDLLTMAKPACWYKLASSWCD